jgi:hypothetical protein
LTYEGLLDEMYGVKSTFITVPATLLGVPGNQKSKKVALNSNDPIFAQIRNLNFAMVGNTLSHQARKLFENYEERHNVKTVTQIKQFVGKLGGLQSEHQSLRLHTNLAEDITKRTVDLEFNKCLEIQQNLVAGMINSSHLTYIEEMIAKQASFTAVIRLLSLYSLVSGGIAAKKYDYICREIVQVRMLLYSLNRLMAIGIY